ncbi:MAG: glycosyltransferase [Candidatus Aminicenantes bacterium]|nr:glycosyltransferase [Candidatus Aminicenantes bacterium]
MNIAFVVQRYGTEVMGGSEFHCRQIAEHLAQKGFNCTVFTTTAKDYIRWGNEYDPGCTELNQVTVKRFKVHKEREIQKFNQYSDWIFSHDHSLEQEIQWMERQGPFCPDLVKALETEEHGFDVLIFFTYLYYNTYWGLKRTTKPKILVPTAHNEPPLHLDIMKEVFERPDAFIFNTESEKRMLSQYFGFKGKYGDVVGVGIDVPESTDARAFLDKYDLSQPFLLYAGRIEKGKGCQDLFNYFETLSIQKPELDLVLMGKQLMELPDHGNIRYIGFVPLEDKNAAMQAAALSIHPSYLESLCMAALESLAAGTPILVQEQTEPLKDHCLKSNAGLWYSEYHDFQAAVSLLLDDRKLRRIMGKKGRSYVKEHYSWDQVLGKYKKAFKFLGFDTD